MYFQVNTVRTAYNHDKERIDLPPPLTELTQKRAGQSTKMPYVRPYIYTNKHPRFFHFYPCKCLARYARSPIIVGTVRGRLASSADTRE